MANYTKMMLTYTINAIEVFATEDIKRQLDYVCREWLMHEDQALAYRLQSEEYQNHLGHNRQVNAILRTDTPRAKEEQLREDEEAAKVQNELERDLARQEARDAAVAAAIVEELDKQEREKKKLQELKDKELAKKIVEEEKVKVRQRKEIRQVEREAAYLGINSGLDNVAILSRKEKRSCRVPEDDESTFRRIPTPPPDDLSDLSDFCLKPSSSMDEEEMRRLQENQDEELARLLQEQDLKRRGDLLREDQLSAIEAQDKELAKVLQEQERAKAKKAREKARQKALMKQQQQQQQQQRQRSTSADVHEPELVAPPRPPKPVTPTPETSLDDSMEFPQYATITPTAGAQTRAHAHRPNSPQYATPMPILRSVNATPSPTRGDYPAGSGPDLPERMGDSKLVRKGGERSPSTRGMYPMEEAGGEPFVAAGPTTPSAFPNIACAIDPTYQRRVLQGQLPPSPSLPPPSLPPKHLTPSPTKPASLPVPLLAYEDEEEDEYLPPPYMPIQGQRRTSSLEKSKGPQKATEKKPDKNGCKQQ